MLTTWFAHPVLLLTLLAVPVGMALLLYAHFRRQRMTARLGSRLLLRKTVVVRPRMGFAKTLCVLTGIALLGLASAGPRWGLDPDAQHRKGRDVILVLDLSRSMSAEQPSRRELALRALEQLADEFAETGGNRIALIAFAARPLLLFPLTQDYDHLRHTLTQISEDDIPKLSADDAVSGTRIGAALKLAVESYDPHRANRPVIVLLSDGDDPAADGEWQQGITAAKEKQIRVHTVGFGDPLKAENLYQGRELLLYDGKPIPSKLNEEPLRAIAERTGGVYLPAHAERLPLGTFVQHLLDADELREEAVSDDMLPVYQLRYAWCLLPAILFFMLAMFLNEGPKMPTVTPKSARAKLLVSMAAILLVSAADPPAADDFLRQGNDAFAQQEYEAALKFYEQAETLTLDPGQLSFNRAAAYYRLGRHKEAIECYRRCLQDDQAPPERRARAHFDLGNALLQYAGDSPSTLAEAVAEYRACLHQPELPTALRNDARHNLELAQLLWLKAWEKLPEDKRKDQEKPPDPTYPDDKKDGKTVYVPVDPNKNDKVETADNLPKPTKSQKLHNQKSVVLPEVDDAYPISPTDTLATLEREARRIADARRLQRNPAGPATLTTKDW